MIRVLTVGGEYGAGRAEIARGLAERLGWRLMDGCLIEDVARIAHLDPAECERYVESTDAWFQRLHKALWRGGYEGVASSTQNEPPDAATVAAATGRVIREAARQGHCVIVGRGSQCVLQEEPDVFHLFVYAPRPERIARIVKREGPDADPEALMESWDRRRAAYIRRYFGQDWSNRHLYNMMLCSCIGEEAAVEAVIAAIRHQKS
ncbi:MAG: AAA family ATPase [Acidobacteriota bacterium]